MYAQAVQYHAQTAHLLVHYRHIAVFKKIEDECKVVMDEVGRKIRDKMHKDSVRLIQLTTLFAELSSLIWSQVVYRSRYCGEFWITYRPR